MSRGMGDAQRRVIAVFDQQPDALLDTYEIARLVYDIEPNQDGMHIVNEAQLSAVRRSLIALAETGVLCSSRGFHNGRQYWAQPQTFVELDRNGMLIEGEVRHGASAYRKAKRSRP
jgi:hypothetical protein